MKSFLSLITLCLLLVGNSFTQNNDQKENNDTIKKQSVSSADKKITKIQKFESAPLKSKSSKKTESEVSKKEADNIEGNLQGKKQDDNASKMNNEGSELNSKSISKSKDNTIAQRTYEKVEIRKEVKDQEVILTVPNKKRNFHIEKVEMHMERVKNDYSEISDITYSESEDKYKFFFNDVNITDKTGLLKDILIHFQIKEYSITQ